MSRRLQEELVCHVSTHPLSLVGGAGDAQRLESHPRRVMVQTL